ncbi:MULTISPECIES: hypothetical protein [unclassified Pedobacter]|uniref:hypothetical protein n=1 Tax=unclassified Pedobacter TaxID=2628915 RepID=UPI0014241FD9|nr:MULTISPECIES: hypothetical protein [unclassified Pedobacter]NII81743.1 hypothetical protein [Pedobacter sp. SG908]NMN35746.1 hypothetical protein [Pedobacter sp. SG918]
MENFNKNSLKAAVAKYGSLHSDGKTEAEVKAEVAKDEKGYSADQVDAIYDAIIFVPEETEPATYKVVEGKSFRDKDDFSKEYDHESDISHLSQDRIDHLLSIGYIEEA